MNFYEQYAAICSEKGLEPCSQKAAEMFGVTRATISSWKSKNTMPKGETVAVMANALNVSADYLLCRTNDPTDYSSRNEAVQTAAPAAGRHNNGAKKTLSPKEEADTTPIQDEIPRIFDLYNQLDYLDRIRVEAYMEGMLTNDKYV